MNIGNIDLTHQYSEPRFTNMRLLMTNIYIPFVYNLFRQFPCSKGNDFDAPVFITEMLVGERGDRLAPKYI
jgi:hypothetical protein